MSNVPDVELRLPAESAYVAVLRMTTAGLAARLDFTLDDIEDLRMAVGEASALVLEQADPGASLRAAFELSDQTVRVSVAAASAHATAPDQDNYAWALLSSLVGELNADSANGELSITFAVTAEVHV